MILSFIHVSFIHLLFIDSLLCVRLPYRHLGCISEWNRNQNLCLYSSGRRIQYTNNACSKKVHRVLEDVKCYEKKVKGSGGLWQDGDEFVILNRVVKIGFIEKVIYIQHLRRWESDSWRYPEEKHAKQREQTVQRSGGGSCNDLGIKRRQSCLGQSE